MQLRKQEINNMKKQKRNIKAYSNYFLKLTAVRTAGFIIGLSIGSFLLGVKHNIFNTINMLWIFSLIIIHLIYLINKIVYYQYQNEKSSKSK